MPTTRSSEYSRPGSSGSPANQETIRPYTSTGVIKASDSQTDVASIVEAELLQRKASLTNRDGKKLRRKTSIRDVHALAAYARQIHNG